MNLRGRHNSFNRFNRIFVRSFTLTKDCVPIDLINFTQKALCSIPTSKLIDIQPCMNYLLRMKYCMNY